jgi:hypothetical protein
VEVRSVDVSTSANNPGLAGVIHGDSLGVARGVSVDVEVSFFVESSLSSSVDNPDLAVVTDTDIVGSHFVGFPFSADKSLDDVMVGNNPRSSHGVSGDSGGVSSNGSSPFGSDSLVNFSVKAGNPDGAATDSDVVSSDTLGSVFPDDDIFSTAVFALVNLGVVTEGLASASVVDPLEGVESTTSFATETDEHVVVSAFESLHGGLATNRDRFAGSELDGETRDELVSTDLFEEGFDVSNSLGASGHLDLTAVSDALSGASLVDSVVERAESHAEVANSGAFSEFVHAVVDLFEVRKPVGVFALDHVVKGISTFSVGGVFLSDSDALLAGNVAGGFATDDSLADEALFAIAAVGIEETIGAHRYAASRLCSPEACRDGPVTSACAVSPLPFATDLSSGNPSVVPASDAVEFHEVENS